MATATLTLTDFLLARIAEDEAEARRDLSADEGDPRRIFPWVSPERAVAEGEAKRHILRLHRTHCGDARPRIDPCGEVRAIAAVYADHPDYRDEWKI